MSALYCLWCNDTENVVGREVPGVYDGVLFWTCDSCGHAWSRDWSGHGRRAVIAAEHVANWIDATEDSKTT